MKKTNWILIILIAAVAISCKSKQKIQKASPEKLQLTELVAKVKQIEPNFKTANVSKLNLAIDMDGRSFNVSANCKMMQDSAIHISIQPVFGLEMFKLEITPDSIFAFDKFNKNLYAIGFTYFNNKLGIALNFNNLQDMLSNRLFTLGSKKIMLDSCKIIPNDINYQTIQYKKGKLTQNTMINAANRIVKQEFIAPANNYKVSTEYSDFTILDNINFPQKIKLQAKSSKHNLNCDFNISKVLFDNNLVFSSQDKTRYSRADINQLLKK